MNLLPTAQRLLAAWISAALLVVLCSCGQNAEIQRQLIRQFTPEGPDRLAREFLEEIRAGRITDAVQRIDSTLQNNEGMAGLQNLTLMFQGGQLNKLEVIGVNTRYFTDNSQVKLDYQMDLATGWFVGSIVVVETGASRKIVSARFDKTPVPLERLNAFSWTHKSAGQYLFLLLCAANVLFISVSTWLCARSSIRRKGVWLVFILLGFMTVRMNWTTGHIDFVLLSVQLLGVSSFQAGSWAPWVLSLSAPVGAILFHWRRRRVVAGMPPVLPDSANGS